MIALVGVGVAGATQAEKAADSGRGIYDSGGRAFKLPPGGRGAAGGGVAGVECTAGVGCQLPDQKGHGAEGALASTSDDNGGFRSADNFVPTASGAISELCWWGVYVDFSGPMACDAGSGDSFTVTYYNDDSAGGDVPGTVKAGPLALVVADKFKTGNVIVAGGGALVFDEYQFNATHDPVSVTGGECCWIQILNDTTDSCVWLWSTAPAGDEAGAQDDIDGGAGYEATDYDLAFCLNIGIAPTGCGVPDCPPGDVDADGDIDVDDLADLFLQWAPGGCLPCGSADINDDGAVDVDDLSTLFLNWAPGGCL